jgi:hypothetical protein
VGSADTGIDNANEGTNFPRSTTPFLVSIRLRWIRPDGSVGASMSERLRACNEQQYLEALAALGGERRRPRVEHDAEAPPPTSE